MSSPDRGTSFTLTSPIPFAVEERYHIPRSQIWEGSRGVVSGNVHLHVTATVKIGRLTRETGQCLCSKKRGSMERSPEANELLCPTCAVIAERYAITWPSRETQSGYCAGLCVLNGHVIRCKMPKRHTGMHESLGVVWRDADDG